MKETLGSSSCISCREDTVTSQSEKLPKSQVSQLTLLDNEEITVQVWDLSSCACLHTLRGHNKPVQRLEICGNSLYSTAGRKIRVWDLTTFRCRKNIHTQDDGGALRALALGSAGTIYVAGQVGSFCKYNVSIDKAFLAMHNI